MTGRHTAEIPVRDTRLGSEVQPFWLAPRPPQPGDLLRPPTLPVDPHGYIDLARRVAKYAGITFAFGVVAVLSFIVGRTVGGW